MTTLTPAVPRIRSSQGIPFLRLCAVELRKLAGFTDDDIEAVRTAGPKIKGLTA